MMSPYTLRSLGHAVLCGVLHIAYQSRRTVLGKYMVCILFNSCLVLASPAKTGDRKGLEMVANICLADVKIENVDNGKGK